MGCQRVALLSRLCPDLPHRVCDRCVFLITSRPRPTATSPLKRNSAVEARGSSVPAGDGGRLLDPAHQLLLVELVFLVDVEIQCCSSPSPAPTSTPNRKPRHTLQPPRLAYPSSLVPRRLHMRDLPIHATDPVSPRTPDRWDSSPDSHQRHHPAPLERSRQTQGPLLDFHSKPLDLPQPAHLRC